MKRLIKITKFFLILGIFGAVLGASAAIGVYYYLKPNLPSIDSLKDVQLQVPLRIYSKDGRLISEYGEKRRIPLNFEQIPPQMVNAFLAAEDDRFYEHPGVDYQGLIRAAIQLAITGEKKQGGSTITMQVARNFFLTKKKTYLRKLNEIFLALKIDQELSKNEVLTLYLNKIYLGHRAYGVGAAAQVYYGKTLDELTLPQIAMIAGLPKAPSTLNPLTNPDRALSRRNYVLDRMLTLGFITPEEEKLARTSPVSATRHSANIELDAPYIAEMVRSEVYALYGDETYTGGYSVYTTVDSTMQQAAVDAVHLVCNAYDKRHGYRGPVSVLDEAILTDTAEMDKIIDETGTVGNLIPGIVTAIREKEIDVYIGESDAVTIDWRGLEWAREYVNEDRRKAKPKTARDILALASLVYLLQETDSESKNKKDKNQAQQYWRLAQIPQVNSALVSLDPKDGAINSLVGGYDFYHNKFNRATQAKRQPGSGFKAFIYSAALENGFTAASLINDAPVVFQDAGLESAWRPENYSGKFFGPTRLRYALTKSRNLVSIRLLRTMGISKAIEHIQKFGFAEEELPRNLSLALGTANIAPMQMARGYSVISNGGFLVEPYLISRIEKNNAEVIFEASPKIACDDCKQQAIADIPKLSGKLTGASLSAASELAAPNFAPRVISKENRYIMYSMMQDVITQGTATKARTLNRRDLAGKTGTTNDQRDAWFTGYNQSIATTVWVGFDNNKKLGRGEVGGKAALPGWIAFMKTALKKYPRDNPPSMPAGMITIRIDPTTGKLASIDQKGAIFEVFRAGRAPTERASSLDPLMPAGNAGNASSSPVEDALF